MGATHKSVPRIAGVWTARPGNKIERPTKRETARIEKKTKMQVNIMKSKSPKTLKAIKCVVMASKTAHRGAILVLAAGFVLAAQPAAKAQVNEFQGEHLDNLNKVFGGFSLPPIPALPPSPTPMPLPALPPLPPPVTLPERTPFLAPSPWVQNKPTPLPWVSPTKPEDLIQRIDDLNRKEWNRILDQGSDQLRFGR
jgi:hypothetical protein